jgi:hypothetical protein
MDALKSTQINNLFTCAENVNEIFNIAYKIATENNFPDLKSLSESAQEFNRQIFLIANFLYNPNAENYVDAVMEIEKKMTFEK